MTRLIDTHPQIAKQWHPTKNGNLTSFNVSYGSEKKIWWKCTLANDHEWQTTPNKRTSGRNCPFCSGKKVALSNCLATKYPEIAAQWHPTKNGNLTPFDVAGGKREIWWKCNVAEDHEWKVSLDKRIHGRGCPCCCGRKAVLSNCLLTVDIQLSKQWHPTKNGNLTPFDVVLTTNKKIWWICEKGHEWCASISHRTYMKSGCPVCNQSRGEAAVAKVLTENNISFIRQWKDWSCRNKNVLPFDFAIKNKEGIKIIEYQGKQHYEPIGFGESEETVGNTFIELQKRDEIKYNWCKEHNIPLLAIPYWDFNKIEKLIQAFIKG
jgi:hypothetical protein